MWGLSRIFFILSLINLLYWDINISYIKLNIYKLLNNDLITNYMIELTNFTIKNEFKFNLFLFYKVIFTSTIIV